MEISFQGWYLHSPRKKQPCLLQSIWHQPLLTPVLNHTREEHFFTLIGTDKELTVIQGDLLAKKGRQRVRETFFFFLWIGGGWSSDNFCYLSVLQFCKMAGLWLSEEDTSMEEVVLWVCLQERTCSRISQERTDLQIRQEGILSHLAPGTHATGWPDCLIPLPRATRLQENTTQCRELSILAEDLF